mgnify:CR=1 FL=1
MHRRKILSLALAGTLLASATSPAAAQGDFPSKPISLVVPFAAGNFDELVPATCRLGTTRGADFKFPGTDVTRLILATEDVSLYPAKET